MSFFCQALASSAARGERWSSKKVVPPLSEVNSEVRTCLGRCIGNSSFPDSLVGIIAKYAMERFDEGMFGPEQWKTFYGAIPITLPCIDSLRDRAKLIIQSTGKVPEKLLEEMSPDECANFVQELGKEENPQPSDDLYECLNTCVRPNDTRVAGLMCAVTYIPEYVRKGNKVIAVTSRTLALEFGPNPIRGQAAELNDRNPALNEKLKREDADGTQPSCYFVMEADVDPDTIDKKPSILIAQRQDQAWKLPEPRNFMATVFSRRVSIGQFLYGQQVVYVQQPCAAIYTYSYIYTEKRSRGGHFLSLGGFNSHGLHLRDSIDFSCASAGAGGSRKFSPLEALN